ncbi:TPA: hypothetical protein MB301_003499 [Klebsiella pneumoniae]|nr:bacteriophage protein [Klebsiella pneumoniae]HBT4562053.1 hypothetical protein [Klebsiella pneumoniae]HDU3798109.1 hypothetical protein [Klebsiella pneumoniae]
MSQNWMRHFELQLLDDKGQGIALSDFKVVFDIQKMAQNSFASFVGNFKVYNLTPETCNRIQGQEFSKIRVIAGYDGIPPTVDESQVGVVRNVTAGEASQPDGTNYGMIFSGDIRFTIQGKDNPTDSWILVQCIDCWEGHLAAQTTVTLAAGWTWTEFLNQVARDYAPYGITMGRIPELPTTVFPRGRTIFKASREAMDDVARQCKANWWYEDGQINMLPPDKYLHEAIVLNADTGLIGMPQQTMGNGVNVRILINPNVKLGGLIRLDQASVYRTALSADEIGNSAGWITEQDNNGNRTVTGAVSQQPASINTDGDYIVGSIDYHGDTRGQAWYMDLLCIAKGSADIMSQSTIRKVDLG